MNRVITPFFREVFHTYLMHRVSYGEEPSWTGVATAGSETLMSRKFILLVEGNYNDEMITRRAFAKNEIEDHLIVVRDGQQAIDFIRQDQAGAPSLILMDLTLPKIDGLTVLKSLRENERTQNVPVVVLTASDDRSNIRKSHQLGVNSFIRKPVDFKEFVETIHQLGLYWLKLDDNLN